MLNKKGLAGLAGFAAKAGKMAKGAGGKASKGFQQFRQARKARSMAKGAVPSGTPAGQAAPSGTAPAAPAQGPPPPSSMSGGGGGGGFLSKLHLPGGAGMWLMIALGLIVVIAVGFYFVNVGGFQATAGMGYTIKESFGTIFQSLGVRQLMNKITDPFGLSATSGKYEEVDSGSSKSSTAPNQAFKVSTRAVAGIVEYEQEALTFIVEVENTGSNPIKEVDLSIDSPSPKSDVDGKGCLRFGTGGLPQIPCSNPAGPPFECTLKDISPFSTKELVLTRGYIDSSCMRDAIKGGKLKANIATDVLVKVTGSTYYPTSSRLAVEKIKTDYAVLLFQNNLLRQTPTGSVYQVGTAMTIDMDIGDQPILSGVSQGGLLMSWLNVGSGAMDSDRLPFLFVVTPREFGQCKTASTGKQTLTYLTSSGAGCQTLYQDATSRCNEGLKSEVSRCSTQHCTVDIGNSCDKAFGIVGDTANPFKLGPAAFNEYIDCATGSSAIGALSCDDSEAEGNYLNCVEGEGLHVQSKISCYDRAENEDDLCGEVGGLNQDTCSDSFEKEYRCVICDQALAASWCDDNSFVSDFITTNAPNVKNNFDWACELAADPIGDYHVCATNGLTEEFNVFTCPLDLTDIDGKDYPGENSKQNRITKYITAMSLYPYKVSSAAAKIQAYCTERTCPA